MPTIKANEKQLSALKDIETALKIAIDMRAGLFRRITARERGGRLLIGKDDRGLGHRIRHERNRYSSSSSSMAEPSMA